MNTNQTSSSAETSAEAMGNHRLMPHLVCADAAKAIAFYKEAFDATEIMRLLAPDGRLMHASVIINGSPVMLADEFPEMGNTAPTTLKGTPVTIHLIVDDVDVFTAKAIAAGATIVMPVSNQFWGDRYGIIADPFGHHWSIATPGKEPLSHEELQARAANMTFECGPDSPATVSGEAR